MFYSRKSPRMRSFDYTTPTCYFVTICTYEKKCLFGKPNEPNAWGIIADTAVKTIPLHYSGVKIEKHIVMPNHIHMLLLLSEKKISSLSMVIGSYKSTVSKQIHLIAPDAIIWQRSFHDHVVRTESAWQKIWQYIEENPLKWEQDCFYHQP